MKINKLLILISVCLLSGCEFIYNPSNSNNSSNSDVSNSTNINNSDVNNNSNNDSSTGDVVVDEINHFRSQIDRSKIIYTQYPQNDDSLDLNKLEIFQINDTHGAYYDEEGIIGISRVKTCIKENCDEYNNTVKIANGDMMQGTAFSNLFLGEPAVIALNEMNFDCFVIGNHEFDWGLDKLSIFKDNDESNGELKMPFLGANIINANGVRPDWIEPYTIVSKGDVKVGIIGVVGDGLESSISETVLNGYSFTDTVSAVTTYCNELANKDVDIVIVATHAHDVDEQQGINKNQDYVDSNKIDCIINAHDHQKVSESVTRYDGVSIPVIESNTKNITMGKVTLNLDSNNQMTSYNISHFYPNDFAEDANLKTLMSTLYDITSSYINEELGYKRNGFTKEAIATSTCDYIAKKYEADLVFVNTSGVRANISSSNIKYSDVYEVFPFDNEIYVTTVSGSELRSMIGTSHMSNYYYNTLKLGEGTSYTYADVVTTKKYKVVTIDYVGTKYYMKKYFDSSHGFIKTGDYIRQCAVENIKNNFKNN